MINLLGLFFIPFFLSAADRDPDENLILSDQSKKFFSKEQKTAQKGVEQQIAQQQSREMQKKQQQEGAASSQRTSSDVMIVDPKVVAKDWVNAFHALNQRRLRGIVFLLRNQSTLTDVAEIEAMPGGYLMLFTRKTVQGVKYQIVKTGDIISLETR